MAASPLLAEYGTAVDRESAYERLTTRLAPPPAPAGQAPAGPPAPAGAPPSEPAPREQPAPKAEPSVAERVVKSPAFRSFARSAATVVGREIMRSVFGVGRRR